MVVEGIISGISEMGFMRKRKSCGVGYVQKKMLNEEVMCQLGRRAIIGAHDRKKHTLPANIE